MNIETIKSLITNATWCLPIVTGLVQIFKWTFPKLNTRFIPAVSIVLGIATSLLIIECTAIGVVVGIILGLGATGLWEFGKTTVAGK